MKYTLGLLLCLLGLWSCAKSPTSMFYRINPLTPAAKPLSPELSVNQAKLNLGFGPLRLADYLDQPNLVFRRDENQIGKAEFHQWAGSLHDNLSSVLTENLSWLLASQNVHAYPWPRSLTVDFQVSLDIIELEGSPGHQASLKTRWRLFQGAGKKLLTTRLSRLQENVEGPDFTDLVAAQSRLLAALSHEIAQEIQRQTILANH